MPAQTETIAVPKQPADRPEDQRAIHIPSFLNRILPYYGQPKWLEAQHWRNFVRNQPIAIICRDTLISNMLDLEWDIVPKEPEEAGEKKIKRAIDYYKELFTYLEGDFDLYLELMLQDMLDLPFGAASEIGRWDDDPEMPVIWAEHIDAATLFPTGNDEFPVAQQVPDVPGVQVVFPEHAISRMYMTPRTELRLKGWGMAPPQKVFIGIDLLYKGDQYYWKMLVDTPEAGILDLADFKLDDVVAWREGFRDLFQGLDGFKIPILYDHETPAQWIPFNRSPNDMLYDETYRKYAMIVAAAYGLSLSDIGLDDAKGGGTLAGVIRQERQSKRTGKAILRSKTTNHFNSMLPEELQFVWKEADAEDAAARGKGLLQISQGLKQAIDGGLLDQAEGRAELVASGMLRTDVDPNKVPEKPQPQMPFGMGNENPFSAAKAPGGVNVDEEREKVPVDQGGRGGPTPFATRQEPEEQSTDQVKTPERNPAIDAGRPVIEKFMDLVKPSLQSLRERAGDPQLRRLIKAATREMFPTVAATVRSLTDEQIAEYWLPEMQAATWDQPNEVESPLIRRDIEEAKAILERHLEDDPWWSMASAFDKAIILQMFTEAYEVGLGDMALQIVRALYEEGYSNVATMPVEISFNLVNTDTIEILERSAADLVTNVDQGTKYFLKRMITSGVRQGLSSPQIAAAIREGDAAERILRRDDYMEDVAQIVRNGLIEMTEWRSNSIVNTEIAKAENAGRFGQLLNSGFTTKRWVHYGSRGVTDKGNVHPCPVCDGNEKLGVVPIAYVYPTVFKTGGVDGDGGELYPPGHPGECHCGPGFDYKELPKLIASGQYTPWTGD